MSDFFDLTLSEFLVGFLLALSLFLNSLSEFCLRLSHYPLSDLSLSLSLSLSPNSLSEFCLPLSCVDFSLYLFEFLVRFLSLSLSLSSNSLSEFCLPFSCVDFSLYLFEFFVRFFSLSLSLSSDFCLSPSFSLLLYDFLLSHQISLYVCLISFSFVFTLTCFMFSLLSIHFIHLLVSLSLSYTTLSYLYAFVILFCLSILLNIQTGSGGWRRRQISFATNVIYYSWHVFEVCCFCSNLKE